MVTDTVKELEKIFMTYDSALNKLKLLNLKTKNDKEITYIDLQRAVQFMIKKHPTCRWKQNKLIYRKNYILAEGFYWLIHDYLIFVKYFFINSLYYFFVWQTSENDIFFKKLYLFHFFYDKIQL